jgi:hypothetical protein
MQYLHGLAIVFSTYTSELQAKLLISIMPMLINSNNKHKPKNCSYSELAGQCQHKATSYVVGWPDFTEEFDSSA